MRSFHIPFPFSFLWYCCVNYKIQNGCTDILPVTEAPDQWLWKDISKPRVGKLSKGNYYWFWSKTIHWHCENWQHKGRVTIINFLTKIWHIFDNISTKRRSWPNVIVDQTSYSTKHGIDLTSYSDKMVFDQMSWKRIFGAWSHTCIGYLKKNTKTEYRWSQLLCYLIKWTTWTRQINYQIISFVRGSVRNNRELRYRYYVIKSNSRLFLTDFPISIVNTLSIFLSISCHVELLSCLSYVMSLFCCVNQLLCQTFVCLSSVGVPIKFIHTKFTSCQHSYCQI